MPLPLLLLGAALAAGGFGVKKGADALSDTRQAQQLQKSTQVVFDEAQAELKTTREATAKALDELGQTKLDTWNRQILRFVDLFERLKNVELTGEAALDKLGTANFSKAELLQMREIALKFSEIGVGGTAALGAGALAGVAAYGGVATFAAASTGTAISALSGAAATNATLAWFGGGSLAAGGMGMAGGAVVLGGIVTGPVLAVGGFILSAKAREKLAKARINLAEAQKAAEEMRTAVVMVKGIQKAAQEFNNTITALGEQMGNVLDKLAVIVLNEVDYSRYTKVQKKAVHQAVLFAQVMKILLETPLLTPQGALAPEHVLALNKGRNVLVASRALDPVED